MLLITSRYQNLLNAIFTKVLIKLFATMVFLKPQFVKCIYLSIIFRRNKTVNELIISLRFEGKMYSFRILFISNLLKLVCFLYKHLCSLFSLPQQPLWRGVSQCQQLWFWSVLINQLESDITSDKQILVFNLNSLLK